MPFEPRPASEQGPLLPGEQLCDLAFSDVEGQPVSLYKNALFGWPKLLFLCDTLASAEAELRYLAERHRDFAAVETHVIVIAAAAPPEMAEDLRRLQLPYGVLSDGGGDGDHPLHRAARLESGQRLMLFDSLLRLQGVFEAGDGRARIDAALVQAQALFASRRPMPIETQPPALVLSDVLEAEHCRRLIEFWHHNPRSENAVSSQDAAYRANTGTKVRADAYVGLDSPEMTELLSVMRRRLLPEIEKAFNFKVTRLEPFRIGCYDGAEGGRFAPHRDNTTPVTRHRRYALTLNLNSGNLPNGDYEGGFLRLPEFGGQLYAPRAGGAVVFSCSLLHMVTPVTRGRRFALIGFLWGEEQQAVFYEGHPDIAPDSDFNLIRW